MIETIQWNHDGVVMIDQTRLPSEEEYVTCRNYMEVADAIRTMVIRGAPAIGVAAAMGIALGLKGYSGPRAKSRFDAVCAAMRATRPTAVNLAWAVERMRRVFDASLEMDQEKLFRRMIAEAVSIHDED